MSNCAESVSWTSIGSACWLMKTERSVWFGYTGTFTPVILRVTFFLLPTVVVVFLTMSVTWSSPQRSTDAVEPWTVFVVVTIFFFGVVALMATAPATAAIMVSFPLLECEAFGVNVAARDAGGAQPREHRVRHAWRSADVDVAFREIGDELVQVL